MSKQFEVYVEVAQRFLEVIEADDEDDAEAIAESLARDAMNLRNVNTCSDVFTEIISITAVSSDEEEVA